MTSSENSVLYDHCTKASKSRWPFVASVAFSQFASTRWLGRSKPAGKLHCCRTASLNSLMERCPLLSLSSARKSCCFWRMSSIGTWSFFASLTTWSKSLSASILLVALFDNLMRVPSKAWKALGSKKCASVCFSPHSRQNFAFEMYLLPQFSQDSLANNDPVLVELVFKALRISGRLLPPAAPLSSSSGRWPSAFTCSPCSRLHKVKSKDRAAVDKKSWKCSKMIP
mmetsp:Transcript_30484/g.83714  ORF Transcript_30484/g.83714 Transcript_30484/m.83714 type:complete len:226 (-) Transcript_30484:927-1604(-)